MHFSSYLAIGVYVLAIILIGRLSYNKHASASEYLLGGRGLGPVVTALSAGASDMSGWMLLGMPGAFYASGICNVWIAIGLVVGAYCNYLFLAKRLRIYTEVAKDSITIPDFLENRFKDSTKILRVVSGLLILVFFTLYVSSGIIAGGKSFESFFGLSFASGAIFTLAIVVGYTFFGGFRTVALTDAFQGSLMLAVLILVPTVGYLALNLNPQESLFSRVRELSPSHLDLFFNQSFLGVLGLLSWGLGYFGQPHIIVRFMAIKSSRQLDSARRVGIGWMGLGLFGAMASGLIGFAFFSQSGGLKDAETVFLRLGDTLFHPFLLGIIVSAVLAAIMSTIASQLLVSASSVSRDFVLVLFGKKISPKTEVLISRLCVLGVGLAALILAFGSSETVLNVVGNAWAGFGASFGPVLLFSLYWRRMSALAALFGMIAGGVSVLAWIGLGLSAYVYELLPGFVISSVVIVAVSLASKTIDNMTSQRAEQAVRDEFDHMQRVIDEH